jgi:hypothetical protein
VACTAIRFFFGGCSFEEFGALFLFDPGLCISNRSVIPSESIMNFSMGWPLGPGRLQMPTFSPNRRFCLNIHNISISHRPVKKSSCTTGCYLFE